MCTLSCSNYRNTSPYRCVSYVWGTTRSDHSIFVNNVRFIVTANLYALLRQLRQSCDSWRVYWVDQICINQGDAGERSQQVQRMRDIYSCAESVKIWLGEPQDDSDKVMEFVPQLLHSLKGLEAGQTKSIFEFKALGIPDISDLAWKRLALFLERPWFKRFWTVGIRLPFVRAVAQLHADIWFEYRSKKSQWLTM